VSYVGTLKTRGMTAALGVLALLVLTWLWQKTQSVNPEEHAHIDATLRELRSLDRTINQDVLRARYRLISSYEPVLRSYRRIEELEAIIATPQHYLDEGAKEKFAAAVADYRAVVTSKQSLIETFKFRTADLTEVLTFLASGGATSSKAALDGGDRKLAGDMDDLIRLTLLYNLTSEERFAGIIKAKVDALADAKDEAHSYGVRRGIGIMVLDVRRLLRVKPAADGLLRRIFDEPVLEHEENVARIYYAGYSSAEHRARGYRVVLYGVCIALFGLLGYGVRRLQHSANELTVNNAQLEEHVGERTRELDARNREMRIVLDNVDQALFTVDLDGKLERQRSAALDRWFPAAAPGMHIWDLFKKGDPEAAAWMTVGWDQLRSGILPIGLALDQLPRALTVEGSHYEIGYRPIGDEPNLEKILLVVSDVTDLVERERREAVQQEHLIIFQHVMRDGPEFDEFFTESERLVESTLQGRSADKSSLIRALHTLKGNCGMYGVTSVASVCHDLESELVEGGGGQGPPDLGRLAEAWATFSRKVRAFTRTTTEGRVEFTQAELQSLRQGIAAGKAPTELLRFIREVEREPVARRLAVISEQARRLGRRLGKGEVVVTTEAGDLRLDGRRWSSFWAAFVHMLRNALDHGIEPPEERLALGKPIAGRLSVRTLRAGDQVVVEISDDGRGIDWDAVRAKALQLGLAAETEDQLLALLFQGGLSTKTTVTEYSGRGAGLSACRFACLEMGGCVAVISKPGLGTTFRFTVPDDDAVRAQITSAA
jgi:two-component system chemotaxis sensor kinase CheA